MQRRICPQILVLCCSDWFSWISSITQHIVGYKGCVLYYQVWHHDVQLQITYCHKILLMLHFKNGASTKPKKITNKLSAESQQHLLLCASVLTGKLHLRRQVVLCLHDLNFNIISTFLISVIYLHQICTWPHLNYRVLLPSSSYCNCRKWTSIGHRLIYIVKSQDERKCPV